ncbi:DMT family transporter [Alphaproteobacteria bacterium]|jgi:drug/metabolite transporter (DMT)-like permease|nr:DMT family transporter [Alphaproteobacteria bacterium]
MTDSATHSLPSRQITGLAIGGLVLLGLTWGLFFSLSRIAGETGVEPMLILSFTLLAEIPIFGAVCLIRGRYPRLFRPASMLFYLIAGILGYMIPAVLELHSAPLIGAGLLTIIVSITPIITMIVAFFMKTDVLNRRKILGILLASLAILPILLGENLSIPVPELAVFGLIIAGLVPLCYGIYHNVISKFWPDGEDGWQLASGEAMIGCFTIMPITFMIYGFDPSPIINTGLWSIMLGYVVLSAVSIYLYFYLIDKGGPIFVSLAGFISLVAGVGFGMVFFGETHPWWMLIVLSLMVFAIWLATSSDQIDENNV